MGLSWRDVVTADAGQWSAASLRWGRLADGVEQRLLALTPLMDRLPLVWRGAAATQAGARLADLKTQVRDGYLSTLALAQVLSDHAVELSALQASARALTDRAAAIGVRVDVDGRVIASDRVDGQSAARVVSEVVWQRNVLLRAAEELDARTAAVIRANLPVAAAVPAVDLSAVPKPGTDPRQVKAWWDSLTEAQQRELIATHPELVGNLDGVPVVDRDAANRLLLVAAKDDLLARRRELAEREAYIKLMAAQGRVGELYPPSTRRDFAGEELARIRSELGDIDGKVRGIDNISGRLATTDPALPRAYLMGFSTNGDGRAIVAVGNPDTADNVLTYVPGTGAELSKVGNDVRRLDTMVSDAAALDATATTAGVLWLGYDAPDTIGEAARSTYAENAAADLDRFADGLRVSHEGPASHNVLLGHSYGSTAIGQAAMHGAGVNADDLIFVASPGVDTNSAADLKGPAEGHVWATRADNDIIRWVPDWDAAHGNDPVRDDFGARVFTSDPGDPDTEGANHSSYWTVGNPARRNIARIVTGQYGMVN